MKFLKENWWNIVNIGVLIAIYAVNKGNMPIELLSGLWIFTTLAYYGYKWFTKK